MNKRSTKWYRKNEAEVMKRLGFKETRNSGATWIEKGDGQNEHCICELKSTDKESYSLKQTTLHVLEAQAIEAHKLPVFALQFINTDEVWIAVKETDIEAFKQIVRASVLEEIEAEIKERNSKLSPLLEKEFKKSVDRTKEQEILDIFEEEDYNNDSDLKKETNHTKNAKANLLARKKYQEQREKERKEKQKAWKKRLNKKA